ncbi:hypothetical protein WMY93_014215 [Mugilogobius chulae]|uniref:Uncharacterized protein n=1 Tax=Mugilogobius chulae TaxID=88201 RepID=A0AAW0NYF0_9GOBI
MDTLYQRRITQRASRIISDHSHPLHHHFNLLPSRRRYRSLPAKSMQRLIHNRRRDQAEDSSGAAGLKSDVRPLDKPHPGPPPPPPPLVLGRQADRPSLLQSSSPMYLTTYQSDYVRFSPEPLQLPVRSSVRSSREMALVGEPSALSIPWSAFIQNFYRSSNSSYGSFLNSSSAPTLSSTIPVYHQQRAERSRSSAPLLGVKEPGHLVYVFEEPGVIVVSSRVGVACCDNFLESVYREAGLEHLLKLPNSSTQMTCAEWDNAEELEPFREVLRSAQTKQPQCNSGGWRTANSFFQAQDSPTPPTPPAARPAARVYQLVSCRSPEPFARPRLFQYTNRYICDVLASTLNSAQERQLQVNL